MYMKQIHQFLSSIKREVHNENWFLFSASRCTRFLTVTPARVRSANGVSIRSAVLARLTAVTNRHTDHEATSLGLG